MSEDKILEALRAGDVTVKQVVTRTELGETTVRTKLNELADAGVVTRDEDGRWLVAAQTAEPEPEPEPEKAKTGGDLARRHAEAVARDTQVLDVIKQSNGITRDQIAQQLNITSKLAYMSLWRLNKQGVVQKNGTGTRVPSWTAV